MVLVTFDDVGCDDRTTKPGLGDADIALDVVMSVAAVGFFGWMEMDGLTRTILTVRFSPCDCNDSSLAVTILRFKVAPAAAACSCGRVVSLAGLPAMEMEAKILAMARKKHGHRLIFNWSKNSQSKNSLRLFHDHLCEDFWPLPTAETMAIEVPQGY